MLGYMQIFVEQQVLYVFESTLCPYQKTIQCSVVLTDFIILDKKNRASFSISYLQAMSG